MQYNQTAIINWKKYVMATIYLGMGIIFFYTSTCFGLTFTLPTNGDIVGEMKTTTVRPNDNISKIGRRFDIGGYEMKEANPRTNYLSPILGKSITIPSRFILPSGSRKGIVINLAELRIYYYHPDGRTVSTFPVGIGKQGWTTPLGTTQIVRKRKDPTWVVPESIMMEHMEKGRPIKKSMPPGPKNPLGKYAMNLGMKNIVIHGSPFHMGIGLRTSHGCLRMWPEDVERLYSMVKVGTQVRVVHETQKIGRQSNKIFIESHEALSESKYHDPTSIKTKVNRVVSKLGNRNFRVNWNQAEHLMQRNSGFPQSIGTIDF